MITFNIQAHNGNYYRGHEPSNKYGNCWCSKQEQENALVFTIEQTRELTKVWKGHLQIIIALSSNPMEQADFEHELFYAKGGRWYDYD